MATDCNGLVDAYLAWVRDKITVADVDGICEITTPFLDRHNDRLQIYVVRQGDQLRLTDDGYIIGDLESSGCPLDTQRRRELLNTVLNGFGVREENGELFVESDERDFPKRKHALVQAMLAVNDMFMTARQRVTQFFFEDVERFLAEREVRYSPNVEFTGRSGFLHKYDFVIPSSKTQPERILRVMNKPDRAKAESMIFSWDDTKGVRPPNSKAYAILNDSEGEPNTDVLSAFSQYGIEYVSWTRREDYVEQLAS
ncbi:MAG: DUF1828 domain-containing protein [Candidatus Nealsonbacteria bacterium]|nr:DUF1828 domain-containing protein [Candidatus Nealsonbacteria bacterium]